MIEVKLVTHTEHPDEVCCVAAMQCYRNREMTLGDARMNILRGCIKSGHLSILEHASATFEIHGVSRSLTHQLVRHRIASYEEMSQRYVDLSGKSDYIVPKTVVGNADALAAYIRCMNTITDTYGTLVKLGIPKEDARYVLPNASETRIFVTMNFRSLRHFFNMRCCSRAQWEIRELAGKMLALCKEIAPVCFENAGASCVELGYCPEKESCGRTPKLGEKPMDGTPSQDGKNGGNRAS